MGKTSTPPSKPSDPTGIRTRVGQVSSGAYTKSNDKQQLTRGGRGFVPILERIRPDGISRLALVSFSSRAQVKKVLGALVAKRLFA